MNESKIARAGKNLNFGLCVIIFYFSVELAKDCMAYRLTTLGLEVAEQPPRYKNDPATLVVVEDLKSTRKDIRLSLIGDGTLFLMAFGNLWEGSRISRWYRKKEFPLVIQPAQ